MKTKNTKKIMTVSGEYSVRNFTVADIQSYKGKRQLTKTIPFSEEEAEAAETAGNIKDVKDNKFPYKDVTVSANDEVVNALEKYIKNKKSYLNYLKYCTKISIIIE